MKRFSTCIFLFISATALADKPKLVDTIQILFDMNRVIAPSLINTTNNPLSSRAYLPICPPGSTYVSGVNPNLVQLDPGPFFPYCNCICKGNCTGLKGITSTGGRQPIYKATVTCAAKAQAWFGSSIFPQTPHQYYYCQAGNCSTHPLPATLGYSVPVGGYTHTTKIDFQACQTLTNNLCGAPDASSPGRSAGNIP